MSKILSNIEFISECQKIHGDKYDYSLVNYINAKTKIDIICHEHGIFQQEPFSHKQGHGCSKCANNYKLTTSEFIEKIKKIHGNKYNYSLVEYTGNKNKIKIICLEHGIFEQIPVEFMKGIGCRKCRKLKIDNFLLISNKIHNNKYDYSLVNYKNPKTKIKIICPEHGEFTQLPYNHLKGHGCTKCKNLYNYNTEEFIKKSNKVHFNKYDYSLVNYKNAITKIKILCPTHGIFEQTPNLHLSGNGCKKCSNNIRLTNDEFIEISKKIHFDKYDYSLVDYKNNETPVSIICKKHGIFNQNPTYHKTGGGCPLCFESKGEQKISKILETEYVSFSSLIRKLIKIGLANWDK